MAKGASKMSGGGGAPAPTNYKGQTEAEWEATNAEISRAFDEWIDSNDKKPFEADEYNIYEKMSLKETRQWLMPASEGSASYNTWDEVPEDSWWHIEYSNGQTIDLEPGDSLKGVRRAGIELAVNDNSYTTAIYKHKGSGRIGIRNDAEFSDNNDIWRWE